MAPLRASLARSPPRLGRSQAGGLHPQTPRAAPPGAPSRTGPLLPRSPSRRGSGHGCDGGGGGQPLAVVHARRLAPGGFRASGEIQRVGRADARRGDSGGVPPVVVERWATRGRAVGGQWATRSVVHAVHGPQRCPRRNGPLGRVLDHKKDRPKNLFKSIT